MLPTFEVFGRTVGTYGLCSVIGLFIGAVVMYNLVKKYNIIAQDIAILAVVIALGMLAGGHILYGVTNIPDIIELFKNMPQYTAKAFWGKLGNYFGGMVFYGGLLGSFAAIWIFMKFKIAEDMRKVGIMDVYAVVIPLFHVFGRIGCFMAGCCYGIESSFGFIVHGNELSPGINDVRRFPTPLLEALCNLIIFFVMLLLYKKERFKKKLVYIYLLIYPVVRFGVEC